MRQLLAFRLGCLINDILFRIAELNPIIETFSVADEGPSDWLPARVHAKFKQIKC